MFQWIRKKIMNLLGFLMDFIESLRISQSFIWISRDFHWIYLETQRISHGFIWNSRDFIESFGISSYSSRIYLKLKEFLWIYRNLLKVKGFLRVLSNISRISLDLFKVKGFLRVLPETQGISQGKIREVY